MIHYVYLLYSQKDKGFYIGESQNLKRRIKQHMNGEVTSTHHRRPLKIIFFEGFTNSLDAKARERYLKSGYGRIQLRDILKNTILSI